MPVTANVTSSTIHARLPANAQIEPINSTARMLLNELAAVNIPAAAIIKTGTVHRRDGFSRRSSQNPTIHHCPQTPKISMKSRRTIRVPSRMKFSKGAHDRAQNGRSTRQIGNAVWSDCRARWEFNDGYQLIRDRRPIFVTRAPSHRLLGPAEYWGRGSISILNNLKFGDIPPNS
jgi:hypothetical protein